jgi:isopentenyldiphosphate isomerase
MTPLEKVGEPAPDEIDDIRWVSLETAEALVSRKRERVVLRAYSGERS